MNWSDKARASVAAVIAAVGVVAGASSARAEPSQAAASAALLLHDQEALRAWVLDHSRDVGAAKARIYQAQADLGTARVLAPNPTVDFTVSDINLGQSNPRGLGYSQTSIYSVGVSQTIELGKRGPRIDAARLRLQAGQEDYKGTFGQRVADSRFALARVVYLRARQEALDETLVSARHGETLTKARLDHGDISGNDFDRLTLDTLTLEAEVAKNRAEYESAVAECRALMFAPCEVDTADLGALDGAAPLPDGLAASTPLDERPDIESMRLSAEASKADATLARRKWIPDPTIRVGYTHDNLTVSGDQADTLGVTISAPIPIFDHGQHDAAKAMGRVRELEYQKQAALTGAQADLDGLLRRKAYIEATLSSLRGEALPKSTGVLQSTSRAFERGGISMTDLLLARRTHIQLVLSVMDLRFDFFTVKNELRRVLGLDADPAARGR